MCAEMGHVFGAQRSCLLEVRGQIGFPSRHSVRTALWGLVAFPRVFVLTSFWRSSAVLDRSACGKGGSSSLVLPFFAAATWTHSPRLLDELLLEGVWRLLTIVC